MSSTSSGGRCSSWGQKSAQACHPVGVLPGGVIAQFSHPAQALNDLQVRLAQLGGAIAHQALKNMAAFFESALQEARVEKGVHVEQELIHRNGFHQKILGSGFDGLLAGCKVVERADGKDGEEPVRRTLLAEGFKKSRSRQAQACTYRE